MKAVYNVFDNVITPDNNSPSREDFRNAFNQLRAEASSLPEMPLDEINAEISDARKTRKQG